MPRKRILTLDEQVLSVLWHGNRSSEQLAKKLGITLYRVSQSCRRLKEVGMLLHENDLWRIHYRDGIAKKIVEAGNGTLSEILAAHKRKVRNKATVDNQTTYSGKRGSAAEWLAGARMLVGNGDEYRKHLAIFGFTELPTAKQLRDAWKDRMKKAHPDVGGSTQHAALINEAYEELSRLISA